MKELIASSSYFGLVLSVTAYMLGEVIRKKTGKDLANPLLIAILVTMTVLKLTGIEYADYKSSAGTLSWLLTPATVCLAIPLYEKLSVLKAHGKAILAGIASGVAASLGCVMLFAGLFAFSHEEYITFLPKSITTAIGMGISEELGGNVTVTIAVIIISGIIGNIFAVPACHLFGLTDPVAQGVAIGSCSHAIGTSKAMEMGEVQGAVSGLAIAVSGLLTVIAATLCSGLV